MVAIMALVALLSTAGYGLSPGPVQEKKARTRPPEQKRDEPKQPDDDLIQLRSDLVIVNLSVTNTAGQYAHGLAARDFKLLEDNAPQQVTHFLAEEAPFAATVLIDMSGSMQYKFGLVRGAAATFLEQIRENDQVAVYGFNNKVRQYQDFSNARDLSDYIWDAEAKDNTRLYDCMDEAITALQARAEKRRAILLITDGWDSLSKTSMGAVMKRALAESVTIHAIDLTDDSPMAGTSNGAMLLRRGRSEMKEFAAQTGGRYLHSPQGEKVEESFNNLIEELRNQYTLAYYSSNSARDGRWRRIDVATTKDGLAVRARRGYYAPKD
jgi:Ca-activated chloride channel family protein